MPGHPPTPRQQLLCPRHRKALSPAAGHATGPPSCVQAPPRRPLHGVVTPARHSGALCTLGCPWHRVPPGPWTQPLRPPTHAGRWERQADAGAAVAASQAALPRHVLPCPRGAGNPKSVGQPGPARSRSTAEPCAGCRGQWGTGAPWLRPRGGSVCVCRGTGSLVLPVLPAGNGGCRWGNRGRGQASGTGTD